jgi:hypothetical protein
VPGLLLLQIGAAVLHPERLLRAVLSGALMFACLLGIYRLNLRAAARIQQRLDQLNRD